MQFYRDRRTDSLMRAYVNIALTHCDDWGIQAAAEYLMRRGVKIETALRVLAGSVRAV